MTPGERARIRERVERSCTAQGIPLVVPADVAAAVAQLMAGARIGRGDDGQAA
jgi:hypothetical protein